jgi:hypothetical protein
MVISPAFWLRNRYRRFSWGFSPLLCTITLRFN